MHRAGLIEWLLAGGVTLFLLIGYIYTIVLIYRDLIINQHHTLAIIALLTTVFSAVCCFFDLEEVKKLWK